MNRHMKTDEMRPASVAAGMESCQVSPPVCIKPTRLQHAQTFLDMYAIRGWERMEGYLMLLTFTYLGHSD